MSLMILLLLDLVILILFNILKEKGIHQWVHDGWPSYGFIAGALLGYATCITYSATFNFMWFSPIYLLIMFILGVMCFLSCTVYIG